MLPFLEHLRAQGLAPRSLRRHGDNLWSIGGEVIRGLGYDDDRRQYTPKTLLADAVDGGEAPLTYGATHQEQRRVDATARKLHNFLNSIP